MRTDENKEQWERLSAVIAETKMSVHAFAKHIGLPAAENLYRIKRGQNGISRNLADLIVQTFPEVSKGWLLTGEGAMIRYSSTDGSE